MKERLTNQARKSKEKKEHIYRIAMEMFNELGYEQTTVRDICANAGVTTSTFYNFFGDKQGILLAFYYDVLETGGAMLERTKEHMDHPFQAVCDFFISTSIFVDQYPKDFTMALLGATPSLISGQYPALDRNYEREKIRGFLEDAKAAGTVPAELDTAHVSEYLLISSFGIMSYSLTLGVTESYHSIAKRQFPLVFAAVTEEHINV